jgi:Fe-S-cluster-containing hydrogenase component 2
MKKLAVKDQNACMACLSCSLACAAAFYKNDNPYKENLSCIQIVSRDDKPRVTACPQCGSCAKVCEAGAITKNDKGIFMLSAKLCTGCGKCVTACPFQLIVKAASKPNPTKCIACGICVKACPVDILYIKEE